MKPELFKLGNKSLQAGFLLLLVSFGVLFYQKEPAPSDIVMAIAAGLFITGVFLSRVTRTVDYVDLLAAGFLAVNYFQLLRNPNDKATYWVAITTFLTLAFFTLRHIITNYPRLRLLFKAYFLSALINVALMSYSFLAYYSFGKVSFQIDETGRAMGLFKDPNVAGPFLIPAFIYFVDDFSQRPRWWRAILVSVFLWGIFFSVSRGALIGVGVALVIWLILRRKYLLRRWKWYLLTILLIAISTGAIFSYKPFSLLAKDRFKLVQTYDQNSRAVSWQAGLSEFTKNPSGSGPGSYESNVVESQKENIQQKINNATSLTAQQKAALSQGIKTSSDGGQLSSKTGLTAQQIAIEQAGTSVGVYVTPSAHNTYLRVLSENGAIGFLVFMLFLGGILWQSRALLKGVALTNSYALAAIASWVGILANSAVVDTLHWRLFWYLPALLLATLELTRVKD